MEIRIEAVGRRASGKTFMLEKLAKFLESEGCEILVASSYKAGDSNEHKFIAWRKDAND